MIPARELVDLQTDQVPSSASWSVATAGCRRDLPARVTTGSRLASLAAAPASAFGRIAHPAGTVVSALGAVSAHPRHFASDAVVLLY